MSAEFPIITRYEVVGAQEVIRTNAELFQSFKQGGLQVGEFSTALRENMEGTYAMRRAQTGMRTAIRVEYAEWLEFGRAMGSVGRIGNTLLQMWNSYTLGQIRIERAQRDVSDATKDVAKWQQIYNEYLRDFGSDAAVTREAYENLVGAQDRLKASQATSAKAISDMWTGYLSMGLNAFSVAASSIDMFYHLKVLGALAKAKDALALFRANAELGVVIPIVFGTAIGLEEWTYERLKEAPPTMTPAEKALYDIMPDFMKQQMRFQEKIGLPSIGTTPNADITVNQYNYAVTDVTHVAEQAAEILKQKLLGIFGKP